MEAVRNAFQTDRRATIIHTGLGLLFPIFMGCILLLAEIVTNNINVVHILQGSRVRSLNIIGGEVRLSDGAIIGSGVTRQWCLDREPEPFAYKWSTSPPPSG